MFRISVCVFYPSAIVYLIISCLQGSQGYPGNPGMVGDPGSQGANVSTSIMRFRTGNVVYYTNFSIFTTLANVLGSNAETFDYRALYIHVPSKEIACVLCIDFFVMALRGYLTGLATSSRLQILPVAETSL